jgi:hypothetical protein
MKLTEKSPLPNASKKTSCSSFQSSRDNSNLFFHVKYVFGFSTTIGGKRNTSAYSIFPN